MDEKRRVRPMRGYRRENSVVMNDLRTVEFLVSEALDFIKRTQESFELNDSMVVGADWGDVLNGKLEATMLKVYDLFIEKPDEEMVGPRPIEP